ncbi:metal resistance protein [Providencia rettgeri]|uniref:metal resistance protein n=1 Tax=Providencia TaxID=586 RepID=UPI003B67695C
MTRSMKLGKGLVLFACLMVLICMNQRAVGERLFASMLTSTSTQASAVANQIQLSSEHYLSDINEQNSKPVKLSTCELSSKSLLTLVPAVIEPLFFIFLSLAAFAIFCTRLFIYRANREESHSPPGVRRHLQFCNLRD